ncbi:uncharacterized protein ASPGLDRAFT_51060 [Aspergillus glaucus CBS 516.65]|uniref:Uncharacterized protein n=1 Tax=Aspergillus glaucus CBS 516.65 TaxID=1160497 RepID=A0A1L9V9U0_ASPGL|nr:hypothetical protein ASPGLDRAFT_51060 [Aspergillus glaucus CBS 516.65]OJJ80645.1 hypothetical protein ASPGLDRAFT_51060 [Aspergillus glaucus CBS 516.65]
MANTAYGGLGVQSVLTVCPRVYFLALARATGRLPGVQVVCRRQQGCEEAEDSQKKKRELEKQFVG